MTELEKVEKLRERANVTYEEAKDALDKAGGDLLDALIYLERQGRANPPQGGGYYSGANYSGGNDSGGYRQSTNRKKETKSGGESFADMMKRFGRFCMDLLNKGVTNYLEATRNGVHMFSCPVVVLIVLLVFFFWVTLPLYIISLFFGFRYRFTGPDLERDSVNNVMDSASDVVNDVKRSFTDSNDKSSRR